MENKKDVVKHFTRVDNIVGVLISPAVHMPVRDVDLKIVEVPTSYYVYQRCAKLYRDDISRAEVKAIVRPKYTHLSMNDAKSRNVSQALATRTSTRRDQYSGAKGTKGASSGTTGDKDNRSSRSRRYVGKKYDTLRKKCHRCLPWVRTV